MVRSASPEHGSVSSKRIALGFFMSIVHLCAKQASRVSSKVRAAKPGPIKTSHNKPDSSSNNNNSKTSPCPSPRNLPPKSPLRARPKQVIRTISDKAITLVHNRKKRADDDDGFSVGRHQEFGEGGVWQRDILMGDKCQPLDFSGAIYYDSTGKQLDQVPQRSPRASPLPGYLARRG